MTRTVRPALQVIEYVRRLAPEPRQAIRLALKELARERGDIRSLEGTLAGYYRLRIGSHRIIFNYARDGAIEVIFVEQRGLVYEIFEAEFVRKLRK